MTDSLSAPSFPERDPDEALDPAEKLRQLWKEAKRPNLDDFLAQSGPMSPEQLVEVLHVDQRERWQSGERIFAETYLQKHPSVGGNVQTALDMIYSEFRFRADGGEAPEIAEYLQRFPRYRKELEEQLHFYCAMVAPAETGSYATGQGPSPPTLRPIKVSLVPGSGPQPTEVQTLLQRRLRFLALLAAVAMIFPPVFLAEYWRVGSYVRPGIRPNIAVCLSILVLALAVAGILWRRQSLSLRQLRTLELILFAGLVAFWSWFHLFLYPDMRLAEPPFWFGLIMAKSVRTK